VLSTHWLDQREPYWRRLEALLERGAQDGLRSLTSDELQELGLLYRQIAADLATAREDPSSARVALSLNQLLARAHHTIYSARRPSRSGLIRFFRDVFPATFRANAGRCLVSLCIFIGAAGLGVALTNRYPEFVLKLLGPEMIATIERHEMWTHSIVAVKPLASSAIMTNNLSVAFTTFALGLTAGLGTIYLLFLNGLLLGTVGAACAAAGMSGPLWGFVAPHGVLELPAIIIAGGAGLRLAEGFLFPGLLPRRVALASTASEAVRLVLGCIPILVIAGIIEAFVSPTELAPPLKFGLAAALFALLVLYLMSGRGDDGREARADSAASRPDTR
jgi:uncharacterized membrane protein SpoIIM required for sporulation